MKHIFSSDTLTDLRLKILNGGLAEPWVSSIDNTNDVVNYNEHIVKLAEFLTFEAVENGEIGWWTDPDSEVHPHIYWSKDMETWTEFTQTEQDAVYVTVEQGERLYIKGNNPNGVSSEWNVENAKFNGFVQQSGKWNVRGNSMGLINDDEWTVLHPMIGNFYQLFGKIDEEDTQKINIIDASHLFISAKSLTESCYRSMFYGCANMTTAPELLAVDVLTENCFRAMFSHCSKLSNTPQLSATSLADYCYTSMFYMCSSLTTAPQLPATVLTDYCYAYMFSECSKLGTAPSLPAMVLANYCYANMFDGCSKLGTAPSLPATVLFEHCYDNMFHKCTTLTAAPNLPAAILPDYCYRSMFYECSNLVTPPVISATNIVGQYSCAHMFRACSKLTYTPDLTNIVVLGNYCYYAMFYDCSSLTNVTELPVMNLTTCCYRFMFSNCTSLRVAQTILPATILPADPNYAGIAGMNLRWADESYGGVYGFMFYGCRNLEVAPILPAKQLTTSCYHSMFYYCTKLTRTIILATDIQDHHVSDYIDRLNELVHEKIGPSANADPEFLRINTPTLWLDHSGQVPTRKWAVTQQAYAQWCQLTEHYTHVYDNDLEILTQEEIDQIIEDYNIVYDD